MNIKNLKQIVRKLEEGWPQFRVDNYYPYRYTEEHLLGEIYWELARQSRSSDSEVVRQALVAILVDLRPSPTREALVKLYVYATENN